MDPSEEELPSAEMFCVHFFGKETYTLQGTNISHLGKRKIIFKMPFLGDMLVPWRVSNES